MKYMRLNLSNGTNQEIGNMEDYASDTVWFENIIDAVVAAFVYEFIFVLMGLCELTLGKVLKYECTL